MTPSLCAAFCGISCHTFHSSHTTGVCSTFSDRFYIYDQGLMVTSDPQWVIGYKSPRKFLSTTSFELIYCLSFQSFYSNSIYNNDVVVTRDQDFNTRCYLGERSGPVSADHLMLLTGTRNIRSQNIWVQRHNRLPNGFPWRFKVKYLE